MFPEFFYFFRVPFQDAEQVTHGFADGYGVLFVFLERIGTAAQDGSGVPLGKADLFSYAFYLLRLQKIFDFKAKFLEGRIRDLHVLRRVNALAGLMTVPAGNIDGGLLAIVFNLIWSRVANHWLSGLGTDGGFGHFNSH